MSLSEKRSEFNAGPRLLLAVVIFLTHASGTAYAANQTFRMLGDYMVAWSGPDINKKPVAWAADRFELPDETVPPSIGPNDIANFLADGDFPLIEKTAEARSACSQSLVDKYKDGLLRFDEQLQKWVFKFRGWTVRLGDKCTTLWQTGETPIVTLSPTSTLPPFFETPQPILNDPSSQITIEAEKTIAKKLDAIGQFYLPIACAISTGSFLLLGLHDLLRRKEKKVPEDLLPKSQKPPPPPDSSQCEDPYDYEPQQMKKASPAPVAPPRTQANPPPLPPTARNQEPASPVLTRFSNGDFDFNQSQLSPAAFQNLVDDLAVVMQKEPYLFPLPSGEKVLVQDFVVRFHPGRPPQIADPCDVLAALETELTGLEGDYADVEDGEGSLPWRGSMPDDGSPSTSIPYGSLLSTMEGDSPEWDTQNLPPLDPDHHYLGPETLDDEA